MAHGDMLAPRTALDFSAALLDASPTGSGVNGVWVDCTGYQSGTVVITGALTTTVVNVQGRNDLAQPSPATTGAVIDAITAGTDKYVSIPTLPRWIKASVTIAGTGTVTAILTARRT